jgi:hypothetical protein
VVTILNLNYLNDRGWFKLGLFLKIKLFIKAIEIVNKKKKISRFVRGRCDRGCVEIGS